MNLYIGGSDARSLAESLRPQGIAVSIVSHGELREGAFGFEDSVLRLTRIRALLGEFDTLIAATALHHGLILLTRNRRHFPRIAGLHLYNAD